MSSLCWDGVDILEKEARSVNSYLKNQNLNLSVESYSHSSDSLVTPYSTPIQLIYLLLNRSADEENISKKEEKRYCHRRSGKYYERLCIDLEQSGMWKNALHECYNALTDPFVQVIIISSNFIYSFFHSC